MRIAKAEQLILSFLVNNGASYGLQLVEASRGQLKRGGIYVQLGRMEEKGFVSSMRQADGRRIYELKGLGYRALAALELMGHVSGVKL